MAQTLAIGGENFAELRRANSYYVDKSELLYELVHGANNKVTLFTRPRRFGKTLTMSMIENFFSIFKADSAALFDGLRVMEHADFCAEYMNRYPVIFITLKDVEGLSFDSAYAMLRSIIARACRTFEPLFDSANISPKDMEALLRLCSGRTGDADEADIKDSLRLLTQLLAKAYKQPVILLIDEYDVPLAKAHANGYYRPMLDIIRGLLSAALKTNDCLKFAVVTGCLRMSKESIFTGVKNFASYSVLDERFAKYFGFTPAEVDAMLRTYGLEHKADIIRSWYDGYTFGATEVYCPWDVINYVAALNYNPDSKPRNYWKNTSSNDAISAFFELDSGDVSDKFEALLNGGSITVPVTDMLTYESAYETEDNLWSVLLMTGYLTRTRDGGVGDTDLTCTLRIPNREIAGIFQEAVVDHFKSSVDKDQLHALMQALWSGDEATASETLSDLLWQTISYMDYHENYYHAFLVGLLAGRGYSVTSNRERGLGRPDIELRDRPRRRAIIIEAKRADSRDDMERCCAAALRQIAENDYAKELDGYRQILCYGVAFYRKEAIVRLGSRQ